MAVPEPGITTGSTPVVLAGWVISSTSDWGVGSGVFTGVGSEGSEANVAFGTSGSSASAKKRLPNSVKYPMMLGSSLIIHRDDIDLKLNWLDGIKARPKPGFYVATTYSSWRLRPSSSNRVSPDSSNRALPLQSLLLYNELPITSLRPTMSISRTNGMLFTCKLNGTAAISRLMAPLRLMFMSATMVGT